METNFKHTYTVRFSQLVFHDWKSRGIISSLKGEGHNIDIVHETKRDITITISEWLVEQFIFDLEYQLEIIVANGADGDASMKPVFQRALAKFQAVLQ
jgi:hypothetical protein